MAGWLQSGMLLIFCVSELRDDGAKHDEAILSMGGNSAMDEGRGWGADEQYKVGR